MTVLALASGPRVVAIIGGALLVWLVFGGMVAEYGRERGYPWFPLFLSAIFLGFPLVLLVVTIGSGPVHSTANQHSTTGDDRGATP